MRGRLAVLDLRGVPYRSPACPCLTPRVFRSLICCSSRPLPFLGPAHPGLLVPSRGPRGWGQCVPRGRGITDCPGLLQAYGASEGAIREAGGREPAGQQRWRGSAQQGLQGNWLPALGRGRERGWGGALLRVGFPGDWR